MTKQDKLFFAVRQSDEKEWIDVNTWGYVPQTSRDKAEQTNANIPQWARNNAVVRIAQFKLSEA